MKAYKALNINMTCRGFKFEIGQKYIHDGDISLCDRGFHACKKCSDIFNYYSFDPNLTIIAEVELSGTIIDDGGDKVCASEIVVLSTIDWGYALENLCNTGNSNTGGWNTGHRNTGYRNTGYRNTGDWNTGNSNTGDWNTGDWNTGDWNTGNRNTGDRNTGDWNTGGWNTGYFNSDTPKVRIFGKETTIPRGDIVFPEFLFFNLKTTQWVAECDMTKEEKECYKEHETLGGYLKIYPDSYKDCFIESFDKNCDKKQAKQLIELPNFDYKIFEEISGITEEMINKRIMTDTSVS
jgi:hypothetical protein